MNAYYQTIKRNDIETVQRMCNDEPDIVHVSNDFKYMCKKGNLEMATWFAEQYTCNRSNALKSVTMKGRLHVVKWLVGMCNHKSICDACKYRQLDVVQYLYDYITIDGDFFDGSKKTY